MESTDHALHIAVTPGAVSVSAMSSLLREVQAALREAGRTEPETAAAFEGDQPPQLTVSFRDEADGVAMSFAFADAGTRAALLPVSLAVARRFVSALEDVLKHRPQRTLWGQAAVSGRRHPDESSHGPLAERAGVVLAELSRFPAATITCSGRKIRVQGETAEIF